MSAVAEINAVQGLLGFQLLTNLYAIIATIAEYFLSYLDRFISDYYRRVQRC